MPRFLRLLPFVLPILLAASPAFAIVEVGQSQLCRFHTIQSAVDYVLGYEHSAGNVPVDIYVVVADDTFYNEIFVVDGTGSFAAGNDPNDPSFSGAVVWIGGGYDRECQGQTVSGGTRIGAGGSKATNSVLEVKGSSHVYLHNLTLTDATGVTNGGGINFHGTGLLDLAGVDISANQAKYGAGIFAHGDAPGLTVALHAGTTIEGNYANYAGGGIRIEGETHLFALENQTLIFNNTANPGEASDGTGGGLQVLEGSVADIGSPGYNGTAVIDFNHARYGGGIAVNGQGNVRLFSTVSGTATRVESNDASHAGGGVWVAGGDFLTGEFCASGYGINYNTAANGAAIYVDGDLNGGGAYLRVGDLVADNNGYVCRTLATLPAVAPCAAGQVCNTIDGNTAIQDDGATVVLQTHAALGADDVEFRGNTGGYVLQSFGYPFGLHNVLIADNILRREVVTIDSDSGYAYSCSGCTIAGNSIPDFYGVFSVSNTYSLIDSIVWQPGSITFDRQPLTLNFSNGITNDASLDVMFDQFSNVSVVDPEFVNPAAGDYRLAPGSPAIDYDSTTSLFSTHDLLFNARGLVNDPSRGGRIDIGAYEFQGTNPLFDREIRMLDALYEQTNGPGWTRNANWPNHAVDPCTWYGITCNADHTHVIGIDLTADNLVGTLPGDLLLDLPDLEYAHFGVNRLSGPLPYFDATNLRQFAAYNNQLSGEIPALEHLPSITYLDIANNQFMGPVPQVSGLPLRHFRVDGNRLSGPVPIAPAIPASYSVGDFALCPNSLMTTSNSAWDTLVTNGAARWWTGCDGIFLNSFGD